MKWTRRDQAREASAGGRRAGGDVGRSVEENARATKAGGWREVGHGATKPTDEAWPKEEERRKGGQEE